MPGKVHLLLALITACSVEPWDASVGPAVDAQIAPGKAHSSTDAGYLAPADARDAQQPVQDAAAAPAPPLERDATVRPLPPADAAPVPLLDAGSPDSAPEPVDASLDTGRPPDPPDAAPDVPPGPTWDPDCDDPLWTMVVVSDFHRPLEWLTAVLLLRRGDDQITEVEIELPVSGSVDESSAELDGVRDALLKSWRGSKTVGRPLTRTQVGESWFAAAPFEPSQAPSPATLTRLRVHGSVTVGAIDLAWELRGCPD